MNTAFIALRLIVSIVAITLRSSAYYEHAYHGHDTYSGSQTKVLPTAVTGEFDDCLTCIALGSHDPQRYANGKDPKDMQYQHDCLYEWKPVRK